MNLHELVLPLARALGATVRTPLAAKTEGEISMKISGSWYPNLENHPNSDSPEFRRCLDWLATKGAPIGVFQPGEEMAGLSMRAPDQVVFERDGISERYDALLLFLNPAGGLIELKSKFGFGDPRVYVPYPKVEPPATLPPPIPKRFRIGRAAPDIGPDFFYNGGSDRPDNISFRLDNTDGLSGEVKGIYCPEFGPMRPWVWHKIS